MLLKDKVAIITGGARGIGKEITAKFLENGAQPIIWDIDKEWLKKVKEDLGGNVITQKVNIVNSDEVKEGIDKVLDNFSNIDILINNAGINKDSLLMRMKEKDWDAVINVNLKGTFVCTKAVSKIMMKQREGRIVNISSIVGLMGNPGQANYSASKAGIVGLTKSTAKELAKRGVKVNAIAPGFIKTKMTQELSESVKERMLDEIPMNEFGSPEDVAKVALFLCSDFSNYVTGQVIVVDGGMYM